MIAREDFMTLVHSQQFHHWQTFLNNRMEGKPMKKPEEIAEAAAAAAAEAAAAAAAAQEAAVEAAPAQ